MQHRSTALAAVLTTLALGATPAFADDPGVDPEVDAAVARGATWLRAQQDPATGSLGGFGGDWAITALAAAGVHAADVRGGAAAPSAQDHYHGVWAETPAGPGGVATDLARGILTTGAGGIQVSRITARQNLVARLAGLFDGRQLGSPGQVNDDVFGVLALYRADVPVAVRRTIATFIRAQQTASGGWSFAAGATTADPDMTGAAVAALCRAGAGTGDAAVDRALAYLRERQDVATGGIASPFFGVNTDTTAWVLAGLRACGVDPARWTTTAGRTPVDFLLAQQNPDGSFQYRAGDGGSDLYASQDAIRTLAGEDFSAPPPERAAGPRLRPAPAVVDGTPVPLALAIDHGDGATGDGAVRLCEVTAPTGATIAAVLGAARDEATPAGCVSGVEADGDRVTELNGVAERAGERVWEARRNGEPVTAGEPVGAGDLVAIAYVAPAAEPQPDPEEPPAAGDPPAPVVLPGLQPAPTVAEPPLLRVTIATRRLSLTRDGRIHVRIACPRGTGAAGCRGVLRLRAHARIRGTVRRFTAATSGFTIPAGIRDEVALRVPARHRAGLRRLPARQVRLLAATRDPLSGRIATTRARLVLRTR